MKLLLIINIILISCSSPSKKLNLGQYKDTKSTSYLLPMTPNWINFSITGECHRKNNIQYINIKNLKNSFSLNYQKSIHLQYILNQEIENRKNKYKTSILTIDEENKIFFYSLAKVRTGFKDFQIPSYHRIHLIWIDPFLKDDKRKNELKTIMKSKIMDQGHPVFVSLCHNKTEMVDIKNKLNLNDLDIKMLSTEFFSPFNKEGKLIPLIFLNFNLFFKNKQLYMFTKKKLIPKEFKGKFNIQKY